MEDKYYLCDVEKNIDCKGKSLNLCQAVCFCTNNNEFAKDVNELSFDEIKTRRRKFVEGNIFNKLTT